MKTVLLCLIITQIASASYADEISDFYYSAKRNIDPARFHRADYLSLNFGSPYIFNEKAITANALVGLTSSEFIYDPYNYDDEYVEKWVFEATDLALQISHLRKMMENEDVPEDIWENYLLVYEDHQLERIQGGFGVDKLNNLAYSSVENMNDEPCSLNAERVIDPDLELITSNQHYIDNIELLNCIIEEGNTSHAENLLIDFIKSIDRYKASDDFLNYMIWEPSCQCGNGFFSVAVSIEAASGVVNIISEFAYRVCRSNHPDVNDISQCDGHHSIGNGNRVYLAGDYRYQIPRPNGATSELRSIRMRDEDQNGREIMFRDGGHQIFPQVPE